MGFKLFEVSKQKEKEALKNLRMELEGLVKKKNKIPPKHEKKSEDSGYENLNIISFERSLYRLQTNYLPNNSKDF